MTSKSEDLVCNLISERVAELTRINKVFGAMVEDYEEEINRSNFHGRVEVISGRIDYLRAKMQENDEEIIALGTATLRLCGFEV